MYVYIYIYICIHICIHMSGNVLLYATTYERGPLKDSTSITSINISLIINSSITIIIMYMLQIGTISALGFRV